MDQTQGNRLFPLDALRGFIIATMALDHANYFIAQQHSPGEYWGGPFPAYHSALPFLTRLVTHLSAPGFFFLMGAGMLLFAQARWRQGWSMLRIMAHFWTRGAILILLQLFVVNPIWKAGPGFFPETYIGVLVALGGTMIIASFLLRLNPNALLAVTLGLLLGTALLHPSPGQWNSLDLPPWKLALLVPGGNGTLWSNYPALPWLELVLFGMLFGRWLLIDEKKAYQRGLWTGIVLLALFAVLRAVDGFGNIRPRAGDTWIDFLNAVKYPPSLTFVSLTMGVNLLLLWGFSKRETALSLSKGGRPSTSSGLLIPLVAFGRASLFVYVLHLFLYMLVGRTLEPAGTGLPVICLYWLAGLAILYLPAVWYGRFKNKEGPLRAVTSYL